MAEAAGDARRVRGALSGDGIETRAVGGAVRDALLGLDVTDVDFATTAVPDKVMALARKAGLKAIPTGIAHGTVTVVADGMAFEVTTLRRDVETFGRHAKVAFTQDWAEDAQRRDFTLNALYAGADGTLYDPLGGYEDLAAGRVRFIGDARCAHQGGLFAHPPLLPLQRLLRQGAARPRGACRLRAAARRTGAAFGRARLRPSSSASSWRPRPIAGIEALFDYGLLSDILGSAPRLDRLARLIAIETAQGREPNAPLRLAALCVFVAEDAPRLAARFKLSNAEQAMLALGADEAFDQALPEEDAAKRLLYRTGRTTTPRRSCSLGRQRGARPTMPHGHARSRLPERWQAPGFRCAAPDITALGGLKGPEIGEMLRAVEAAVDRRAVLPRTATQLLAKAKTLAGLAPAAR